jgi:hypothetical protein
LGDDAYAIGRETAIAIEKHSGEGTDRVDASVRSIRFSAGAHPATLSPWSSARVQIYEQLAAHDFAMSEETVTDAASAAGIGSSLAAQHGPLRVAVRPSSRY